MNIVVAEYYVLYDLGRKQDTASSGAAVSMLGVEVGEFGGNAVAEVIEVVKVVGLC